MPSIRPEEGREGGVGLQEQTASFSFPDDGRMTVKSHLRKGWCYFTVKREFEGGPAGKSVVKQLFILNQLLEESNKAC